MRRGLPSLLLRPRSREAPGCVQRAQLLIGLALLSHAGLIVTPAHAEQKYSRTFSFAAAGQNIWGSSPTDSASVSQLFSVNWNSASSGGGFTEIPVLGVFGGQASASTSGALGLRAGAYVKGGQVSVNYPLEVIVWYPDNGTLRPGDSFTIRTGFATGSNASISTTSPTAGAKLDLVLEAHFDASASVKAFSASLFDETLLDLSIGPIDRAIVDTDSPNFRLEAAGGNFVLTQASRGILSGTFSELNLPTSGGLDSSSGMLKSSGASTFFSAKADFTNAILAFTGLPPLNRVIKADLEVAEFAFTLQLLDAFEQLDFKVAQSFAFDPDPMIRLTLSDGQSVDLAVGQEAVLQFPSTAGNAAVNDLTITPAVSLSNRLTNKTDLVISPSLNFTPFNISFSGSAGAISLGSFSFNPVETLTWNQGNSTFSLFNSSFALNGTTSGSTPPFTLVGHVYPAPTIDEVRETLIRQGTGGRELLARGSSFVEAYSNAVRQFPSSTVQWNGEERPTTFRTDTELRFQVTDADTNTEGVHNITVANPAPGGGVSNVKQVIVDGTPPATTALLDGPQQPVHNDWYVGDVTVRLSASDRLSGVKVIDYQDGSGSARSHTPPFALGPAPVEAPPFVLSSDGRKLIEYRSTDNVGIGELVRTTEVKIDGTPPEVRASRSPEPNQHGWNNTDVTVTFDCRDATSGILSCPPPEVLSAEFDNHEVTGLAGDMAGNTATATVSGIKIDKTPPVLTGALIPPANQHGWNNSAVTVRFQCEDALSGLATPCPDDQTLSNEGAGQSVSGGATDKADNSTAATVGPINIDLTLPTIRGSRVPAANAQGWNNAPVTVQFECRDALSGVARCPDDTILGGEGANQSVSGTVTDRADNSASAVVDGISIDLTKPTVTYTGNAGSYTVDQQVSIACTVADNLSGVFSHTGQDVVGPAYRFALGENSFSASATDRAGNQGSGSTSFTVQVTYSSLCALVGQLVSHHGIATSLCQKLRNAQDAGERGDTTAKAGILEAFVEEVAAQSGQYVAAEHVAVLSSLARAL